MQHNPTSFEPVIVALKNRGGRAPTQPKKGPIMNKNKLLAALAAVPLLALLAGCSAGPAAGDQGPSSDAPVIVKIGVVDEAQDYWPLLIEKAKAEGIDVQLVNFAGYTEENPALSQKQIDLNLFQHLQYLGQYNVEAGDDLVPIGATLIYPLGLYSNEYSDVKSIPKGGTVAVPNDPTNLARALFVLQAADLITLAGTPTDPTVADIDKAKSKVAVTPIDAAQTVASLVSVDAAIINNNFLTDAGIDPATRLFADDPSLESAQPYINVIVARAEDKDNPVFATIVALYHEAEVEAAAVKASANTGIPVTDVTPAELQKILSRIQKLAGGDK